jgi:hypothetical protein
MKIEGVESLKKKMADISVKYGKETRTSVIVGFTQRYALHVHEDKNAYHPVGQAKYLEQPAREFEGELTRMVQQGVSAGLSVELSLVTAGLRLQREAQLLTPVDTSALKASAFTCVESELEAVSTAKFAESETIRLAETNAKRRELIAKYKKLDVARLGKTGVKRK